MHYCIERNTDIDYTFQVLTGTIKRIYLPFIKLKEKSW